MQTLFGELQWSDRSPDPLTAPSAVLHCKATTSDAHMLQPQIFSPNLWTIVAVLQPIFSSLFPSMRNRARNILGLSRTSHGHFTDSETG